MTAGGARSGAAALRAAGLPIAGVDAGAQRLAPQVPGHPGDAVAARGQLGQVVAVGLAVGRVILAAWRQHVRATAGQPEHHRLRAGLRCGGQSGSTDERIYCGELDEVHDSHIDEASALRYIATLIGQRTSGSGQRRMSEMASPIIVMAMTASRMRQVRGAAKRWPRRLAPKPRAVNHTALAVTAPMPNSHLLS